VLFLDEVHRFNKAQQDAFLPHVENGTLTFIGATTENPSFEIIGALLSRARVYVLKALNVEELRTLLTSALADRERGLGTQELTIEDDAAELLVHGADGDARRALGMLELAAEVAAAVGSRIITTAIAQEIASGGRRRFDKGGDQFYDQISALHKAVRGSDPDASLYWLARMLDGGCDPHYLARRITRMAIEDVGLADPRVLPLVLDAWQTYERLGSPEGELALAQAVVYLAVAAKSNAVYTALAEARADVERYGSLEVPARFRNAPTKLMKDLGHGSGYRYAHDEPDAFAAGERYFPDDMPDRRYYHPTPRGLEQRIGEQLTRLRKSSSGEGNK
jgi:putative ATPase